MAKRTTIYNHLEDNYHLVNKKNLFLNLVSYYQAVERCPVDTIPYTFFVRKEIDSFEGFDYFYTHYK